MITSVKAEDRDLLKSGTWDPEFRWVPICIFLLSVLRIQIRVFFGNLDLDLLVRGIVRIRILLSTVW
jgi:hypothetical protein